jgi:hypothetical protein
MGTPGYFDCQRSQARIIINNNKKEDSLAAEAASWVGKETLGKRISNIE